MATMTVQRIIHVSSNKTKEKNKMLYMISLFFENFAAKNPKITGKMKNQSKSDFSKKSTQLRTDPKKQNGGTIAWGGV